MKGGEVYDVPESFFAHWHGVHVLRTWNAMRAGCETVVEYS